MRILLIYPFCPNTFWSLKHALKLISKKSMLPPLGALTVAAMLPEDWEKKLIDMNLSELDDEDIQWADYVFISAMQVQKDSVREIISRCNRLEKKIVAGGPLFTTNYEDFNGVDHFVLGEAEMTLPPFLADLENDCTKTVYKSSERPDIKVTPVPLWSLINMDDYLAMNVQYSRGCPFDCEFCDIISLYGQKSRTKSAEQLVAELESLYNYGWHELVFIADDNFIGNKRMIKTEVLPAMIEWSKKRGYPFMFITELTINLADDEELMQLMVDAQFKIAFIGIETPSEEGLAECNKIPNTGRNLISMVKKIQNHGIEIYGGFVIGFDSDDDSIFEKQINFIQNSGIIVAMVGLLMALPGTRLYNRLKSENRLLEESHGDNTDFSLNFIPIMDYETLIKGYRHVLDTIYSPKRYSERVQTFLKAYNPPLNKQKMTWRFYYIWFIKSLWTMGFIENGRTYFWTLLIITLLRYPRSFALSIRRSVYRLHFSKITQRF